MPPSLLGRAARLKMAIWRLRYNALAVINVGIGFANSLLNIGAFGVSKEADAIFIVQTIYNALGLITLSLVEQFLYYYHKIKNESEPEAKAFFNAVFTWTAIINMAFVLLMLLLDDKVTRFFALKVDPDRYFLIKRMLPLYLVSLFFTPISVLINSLQNAEQRYTLPYIFQMVPLVANLVANLYVIVVKSQDVMILAVGNLIGTCALFCIQALYLQLNGFEFRIRLRHERLKAFFVDSFFMRLGHNIFNFCIQPIFSNVLVSLPVGMASSYGYANKISSVLVSITLGPSSNILTTNVSIACSNGDGVVILRSIKKFILGAIALLIPSVVLVYFLIPWVLSMLSSGISNEASENIKLLFCGLILWQMIMVIEGGFDRVLFAKNKALLFIIQNSISIGIILAITSLLNKYFGVWVIPLALVVAQIANSAVYISRSMSEIRRIHKNA
jgi:Na+-driven multidrug efflux pump